MKVRQGFVSNSSSTAFVMTNISDEEKTLVDFVDETPWIVEEFCKEYDWHSSKDFNQETLRVSAAARNDEPFAPGESRVMIFGDEQQTIVGQVYDYMLRGRDISKAGLLWEQMVDAQNSDEENAQGLFEKWCDAKQNDEDKFEGIDSPSFTVRFHEWMR